MSEKRAVDKAAILRDVPLFSALDDGELRDLISFCRTKRVPAGTQIFSSGDEAESSYVILEGKVKLYKLSAKGDEQILHLFGPGDLFGEAAMWSRVTYPAYAEALADSSLLTVTRSILREAIVKKPELALGMIAGMSRKLREFNQLIERLSLQEVPARLAGVLLDLSREAGDETIRLDRTKRELASQIGTVSETLSRALRKLKERGFIEIDGAAITILDSEGLREIAES